MREKYNEEEKIELVKLYQNGESVKDICIKHHISKSTLYYWIHEYSQIKSSSEDSVSMKKYTLMLRRLQRVEQENQIFKLSNCTVSAPLEQKLAEIKRLKDHFSIHALCDVLQVQRSTFYHYLYRRPEVKQIEREDSFYRERIAAIFEESQQRFGASKIKVKLKEEGLQVSKNRIQRLMHELGLECNRDKPIRKYPPEAARQYYLNKLDREFNQAAPNMAWVSDITYCKIKGKKSYICVVIDLFSRKVLSCEVSSNMSTSIVSTTFLDAFIRRNQPTDLIFHSDQGGQYTCRTFQKRLEDLNVKQSFSKPGCPYDNAVVESFFASLKKEEIYRCEYENISQLRIAVESYIEFFNKDRPHQSLCYLTPEQVEREYFRI